MMFTTSRVFLVASSLLLGCSTALNLNLSENQAAPRVGKEFSIKVGEQLKFEGTNLQVKFTGVPQDSRCPSNVNCVWAGNAEVVLEWLADKCPTSITLNTHGTPTGNESKVRGYRVKLIMLEPYPHSEKKISPSDYTATLLVAKE
ncbi:MAG: hypothetical protein ACR2H6_00860 [Pyrinomonadaceae bacterium]